MRKWLIITIVIIIIAVLAYFFWWQKEEEWPSYENSRYSFSLEYPSTWQLGEAETTNAGREFTSEDDDIYCYAYGFENAIITDDGDPQTLEEFIDWMKDEPNFELINGKQTDLGGYPAVELVTSADGKIRQAVYVLGKETGRGLFCVFENLKEKKNFGKDFLRIRKSFRIFVSLDGEEVGEVERCENLLAGLLIPLKDFQSFEDEIYTEVVITSRDAWDKEKLPKKVIELEEDGYICSPQVLEFEETFQVPGMHIEPEVKKVGWNCELEYEEWEYLDKDDLKREQSLEKKGYTCKKQDCLGEKGQLDYIWFCYK